MMKYITYLKNKVNITWIASIALVMCMSSCTDNFFDINTDPYESLDPPSPKATITGMQQQAIIAQVNRYQLAQNLVGDLYSGYMTATQVFDGGQANNGQYKFKDAWLDYPLQSTLSPFVSSWVECKNNTSDNPEIFATAQIIKVVGLHRFTDMWGPIPYTQLAQGLNAPYDSQETVYKAMINDLDSAIAELTFYIESTGNAKPLKRHDLVYEGDFTKWVKLANSLKLRLAMRMSYADPVYAQKIAEEAINHSGGIITSNDESASVKSANGVSINHPLHTIANVWNDIRMSGSMQSILNGYKDPRAGKLFQEVSIGGNTGYFGLRDGANGNHDLYKDFSAPAIFQNAPIQWMIASEVAFLRAEGALRGWNMGGSAEEFYTEGVHLSFAHYGADGAANYLLDDVSKPANYVNVIDNKGNTTAQSSLTVAWNEAAGFEAKLERILTQKWIAIFPDGQEAWSEYRRTGYPKILPPQITASNFNGLIKRYPYPRSIEATNIKGYIEALQLLGGSDNGGTKLWWDKK